MNREFAIFVLSTFCNRGYLVRLDGWFLLCSDTSVLSVGGWVFSTAILNALQEQNYFGYIVT